MCYKLVCSDCNTVLNLRACHDLMSQRDCAGLTTDYAVGGCCAADPRDEREEEEASKKEDKEDDEDQVVPQR
jgi:hypothetical protein